MYKSTLAFLVIDDKVIMINRNKKPWMGCWNGVGGKLEKGEDKTISVIREIEEETKIKKEDYDLEYKGILTWSVDNNQTIYGLYIFVCKLNKLNLKFPIKTSEGILDLKEINWVIDHNNLGVSHNLKYILPYALYKDELYRYHCLFEGNTLLSVDITLLEE